MPDQPGPKRAKGNVRDVSHRCESPSESARRCSYEGCSRPNQSRKFYHIDGRSDAGGQDWTELAGAVLCNACYVQFTTRGGLERTQKEPLTGSARRCSYEGCRRPNQSSQFYQIDSGSDAGGQDWTELAGAVLCNTCYKHFLTKSSLERTRNEPLAGSARRCSYEGCSRPNHSIRFHQINGRGDAGGQDWTELAGAVLCNACYDQFRKRGRLERSGGSGHACAASAQSSREKKKAPNADIEQQPVASGSSSSSSSSSSRRKRPRKEKRMDQEEEEEEETQVQAYDGHLEECFMCLGSGTRVCIVPCGHSICADCGDAKIFKKSATRPFSACPVCREKMCKPWVMDGGEWEKGGKTSYDP